MERQSILNTANKRLTKKVRLLSNPEVKRWYDNESRGNPQTADVNLRRLSKFCDDHQVTPIKLVEIAKNEKTIGDLLQDHVSWMEEKGSAPGYIKRLLTGVKSWLTHNDIEVKRKIKIANVNSTPTLSEERVPEAEELAELFNRASLRSGAIMALIGKAGLRLEVLGNFNGTDGLMIKDMPDLAIVQGVATFLTTPPKIVVRKTLSKAGHEYFTFITNLGGKKVLAYLNDRILSGESLGPESPVIAPSRVCNSHRLKNPDYKFLTTTSIGDDVRKAMRPRFKWRPYVLRAFFDTELLIAESRGLVAHDFRVFWMGHVGSIEAKYTTNKSILPKALLEAMRESFKKSEYLLDLEKDDENPLEKKKENVKETVEKLTPDQLDRVQKFVQNLADCNTLSGRG